MLEATLSSETRHIGERPPLRSKVNRREISGDESDGSNESFFQTHSSPVCTSHLLVIGESLKSTAQLLSEDCVEPNWRVHFTATGTAALDHFQASSPDVILLDPSLPDQGGLDVYNQIRSIDARIPVIFVSRTKQPGEGIEAIRQGAHDYVTAPFEFADLRRVVTEALDVSSQLLKSVEGAAQLVEYQRALERAIERRIEQQTAGRGRAL
jgi:DNA-binding response OmpR family regulator